MNGVVKHSEIYWFSKILDIINMRTLFDVLF
jgi:hypothetical protein